MKIAVFAACSCCDYFEVGGGESVVRRLAHETSRHGHQVDYVLYGSGSSSETAISERIKLYYCQTFDGATSKLDEGYDHVLTVHILPRHRLQYARFQFARRKKLHFHKLMLGTPETVVRWGVFLGELFALTQAGQVFTISGQTQRALARMRISSTLLLPPVPESYFVPAENKNRNSSLMLTYIGRLDCEKGIDEVFKLFRRLKSSDGVHTQVCAYHWSDDRTTLTIEHNRNEQVSQSTINACESIYRPEMQERVQSILRDTDILVLPYHSMKGTIDPPLLLLEGMASCCCILTRPVGNVSAIYGESRFVIRGDNFAEQALELIERIRKTPQLLQAERERIERRATALGFSAKTVTNKLIGALKL